MQHEVIVSLRAETTDYSYMITTSGRYLEVKRAMPLDENLEVTENAVLGLLIALAFSLREQGDTAARRKFIRHFDARVDAMGNPDHPGLTPLWNPTKQDLASLRSMRRWLHYELESPSFPHA